MRSPPKILLADVLEFDDALLDEEPSDKPRNLGRLTPRFRVPSSGVRIPLDEPLGEKKRTDVRRASVSASSPPLRDAARGRPAAAHFRFGAFGRLFGEF